MSNEEIITEFYRAFVNQDADGMVKWYADDIVFEDPAFGKLEGDRAKGMWQMLLQRAKGNLKVSFSNVEANGDVGRAKWTAIYPYGPSKRMVTNEISAHFKFENEKIIEHVDQFDIYKWSRMALGVPGALLGWTPIIKNMIRKEASKGLDKFLAK